MCVRRISSNSKAQNTIFMLLHAAFTSREIYDTFLFTRRRFFAQHTHGDIHELYAIVVQHREICVELLLFATKQQALETCSNISPPPLTLTAVS